jgi:cysteine desulfurase
MIYLDYAATTPVDPRVVERMQAYLGPKQDFGNPGSNTHRFGLRAQRAVEQAREQVAALLNAEPREIIWTSGATESDNLALQGVLRTARPKKNHIITCRSEHKAVLDTCRALEREACRVTYLTPQADGRIDLAGLEAALTDETALVSLMHVNNETGVIQDIAAVGAMTRTRGILFHVDAAQSAGKIPIDVKAMQVDLLSVCAHKIYGPKGIGALYVGRRPRVRLAPLIYGGGQEHGLRAGTLATHQIVGLGECFALAQQGMAAEQRRIKTLRQQFLGIVQTLDEVYLNGSAEHSAPNIINLSFAGIDAEALLMELDDIALSTGSACTSGAAEASHVLKAMACPDLLIHGSIRFSLGRFIQSQAIEYAAHRVVAGVKRLRELSPLYA